MTYKESLFCLSAICTGAYSAEALPKRPNVIVLLADDMGYADIEPYGSTINRTPNLNRLAKGGLCMESFYAEAASSPSRASLMTGCYSMRVGLNKGLGRDVVLFPGDSIGLSAKELTLAEMFKSKGYRTGLFGKWHLGDQEEFLPLHHGFDTFVGIPYSHDMWVSSTNQKAVERRGYKPLVLMVGDEPTKEIRTLDHQAQLHQRIVEESLNFIDTNSENPFFLLLSYTYVHQPRTASKEFLDSAKESAPELDAEHQALKAQIEEIDHSVGLIMDKVEQEGLNEETIIIFLSDNGGTPQSNNKPFRGVKNSVFEGGFRVPAIFWGEKFGIAKGERCAELVSIMDILPTFANMLNVEMPSDRIIDGKDIMPLLRNEAAALSPHQTYYYFRLSKLLAIRQGDWKYHTSGRLFNLKTDIAEKRDVAKLHPEVVENMKRAATECSQNLGQSPEWRQAASVKNPKMIEMQPTCN